MREIVTTVAELGGFVSLVIAGFLVSFIAGFVVMGLALLAIGWLAGR